jgi:hypothetical protein
MDYIGKFFTPDFESFFYFTKLIKDERVGETSYDLSGFSLYKTSNLDSFLRKGKWMYKKTIDSMWEVKEKRTANKLQKKLIKVIFK